MVFFLTSSKSSSRIVGNIQIIFEHLFNGMSNILFLVSWYNKYEIDSESNLMHFDLCSQCHSSVVSPDHVSRPLIHAVEEKRLWIISPH